MFNSIDISLNDIENNIDGNDSIFINIDEEEDDQTNSNSSSNNNDDKINELKYYISEKRKKKSPQKYSLLNDSPSSSDNDEIYEKNNEIFENNFTSFSLKKELSGSDDETVYDNKNEKKNINISSTEIKAILNTIEWDKYDLYTIKEDIEKHFKTDMVTLTSNHLDIIASYLNSQKIIYLESSYITSKWLNGLMIPTIVISCSASVISGAGDSLKYSNLIISCITAFGAFLLAIINYLKLDAASEAHKMTSHQYDKLQSNTMFLSGKTLLFSEASFSFHTFHDKLRRKTTEANSSISKKRSECHKKNKLKYQEKKKLLNDEKKSLAINNDVYEDQLYILKEEYQKRKEKCNDDADDLKQDMINESIVQLETDDNNMQQQLIDEIRDEISILQEKIKEIKESNHFEIPRSIRSRFPFSYGANVFSIIKCLENFKCILIHKLWIIKNNIKCSKVYIQACKNLLNKHGNNESIIKELNCLFKFKEINHNKRKKLYEMIISLKSAYMEIDKLFATEIKNDKIKKDYCIGFCYFPYSCCSKDCKPPLIKIKNNLLYKILNNKSDIFDTNDIDICCSDDYGEDY